MNADIIFILCPYLGQDLGSLSCLAAAYPQWSTIVYRYLRKSIKSVNLQVEFGSLIVPADLNEFLGLLASIDDCNSEHDEHEGDSKSEDSEDDNQYAENGTVKYRTDTDIWRELPEVAWKHMPFKNINIEVVEVSQVGWCPLPDEIHALLENVSTTTLLLQFYSRNVPRRLLQTISFGLGSVILLREMSKGIDKKPILQPSQVMKFDVVTYEGEMSMLSNDLLAALDSHYTLLAVSKASESRQGPWVAELVEKYLEIHAEQVRPLRRGPLEYEFESVPDGGAVHQTTGPRAIRVADQTFESPPFFTDTGVRLVVANFK